MFPKTWIYWVAVAAVILWAPIYQVGKWQGAKEQRTATETAITLASAQNDVSTVSAITGVKNEYAPFYVEIEREPSPPPFCPVPAIILTTVERLPAPRRSTHQPRTGSGM